MTYYNDITPDFEEQIKRTAATIQDQQMVLDALDMQVQYLCDEERGEILKISCVIPFADGQIVLSPSRKSLHNHSSFYQTAELKNRTKLVERKVPLHSTEGRYCIAL